jgi:aminoglycoside phosphotransferase (APT) family kinase protein
MPGIVAAKLISDPAVRDQLLTAAATAIGELHRITTTAIIVDAGCLERWITEPLQQLRHVLEASPHAAKQGQALDRLAAELQNSLAGRQLAVSWIHGDFAPGNILVTPDGKAVTGIVDWELAGPGNLPQLDLVQLLLSARLAVQACELGEIVRQLLDDAAWTADECALLDKAQAALPGEPVGKRALLLLCWLHHIAANLTKSTHYAKHRVWLAKNLIHVLQYL